MKKKTLAVLMTEALAVSCLAACGKGSEESGGDTGAGTDTAEGGEGGNSPGI